MYYNKDKRDKKSLTYLKEIIMKVIIQPSSTPYKEPSLWEQIKDDFSYYLYKVLRIDL
jgi:hypothetical protein